MFSCDFSIKVCAWLLSAQNGSNEHALWLSETPWLGVNAKISATLTLQFRDSEILRKKFETPRPKETHEKRDFVTRHKSFRDFEIRSKISEIHDFLGTIRHPFYK